MPILNLFCVILFHFITGNLDFDQFWSQSNERKRQQVVSMNPCSVKQGLVHFSAILELMKNDNIYGKWDTNCEVIIYLFMFYVGLGACDATAVERREHLVVCGPECVLTMMAAGMTVVLHTREGFPSCIPIFIHLEKSQSWWRCRLWEKFAAVIIGV